MHKLSRTLGQWICLLAITCSTGSSVVSCARSGSREGASVFEAGAGDNDATAGGGGTGGGDASLPTGDGGPAINIGDSGIGCTPKTCIDLGVNCGPNGDGCGGLIQCGTCPAGQACGFGGPSICGAIYASPDGSISADGGPPACVPKTCADLHYNCGPAGDGCGGMLDCGRCTSPQFCGGGGMSSVCGGNNGLTPDGSPVCTPKKCGDWGFDCGPAGDGCGGALQCGACTGTDICGGVKPGVCGSGVPCTNLCTQQVRCDGGVSTSVTGTVFAGMSAWTGLTPDPVPNVLVYVPNAPLQPFAPGAACRQCGTDVSGAPVVSTYTDFDGTFTLTNVPAGTHIPLVVQLGRWRRLFWFDAPACVSTKIGSLNLPRNQGEGSIPFTAISTGNVDALECVLLKMGVDQTEFTPDNGYGRIHIYGGGPNGPTGGAPGATAGPGTRDEAALMDLGGTFMNYDQIMFPCWGSSKVTKTPAELANLITYADSGGHFFATHYSYAWLVGNGEFNNVARWNPNFDNPGLVTWTLNVSPVVPVSPPAPHTGTFAKWLNLVGALSNSAATVPANPQVSITAPRHDADGVVGGSVDWIDGTDQRPNSTSFGTPMVEHFTFNAPVAATSQCGHVIFSDFHVADSKNNGLVFPAECTTPFTAQEKILEYMIWDLSSCAPAPPPPSCRPVTCSQQRIGCGPAGDGCGNSIDCGPCTPPQTCGGGGVPGQCGAPDGGKCTPQTCMQQNIGCGPAGDGCGNALDCGPCTPPFTCGGGGVPGQCGAPDAGMCKPLTCLDQHIGCGPAGDGCGNALDCGPCTPPETCGGGGVPGQCGGIK
jgi:hypothetical protein